MRRLSLLPLLPLLSLASCIGVSKTTTVSEPPAAAEPAEEPGPDPEELARLEHELEAARVRLEIARIERDGALVGKEQSLAHQREDLALAEAELATFLEVELPNRVAGAELSLQASRDRALEAAEELAQLEIMYEDQDLEERTREFVISRGRREAERTAARLAIQEAELTALKERELVERRTRLEIAVARAREGVVSDERELEVTRLRQDLALKEAERAVEKAEAALEKARGEGVAP